MKKICKNKNKNTKLIKKYTNTNNIDINNLKTYQCAIHKNCKIHIWDKNKICKKCNIHISDKTSMCINKKNTNICIIL